jgi:DNA-binding protein YbaB
MFGDLMGNVQQKQEDLRQELAGTVVEEWSADRRIHIKANANREIIDIVIDPSLLAPDQGEELQDLLVVTLNNVLQRAAQAERTAAQQMITNLLPGGMGGFFGR